MSPRSPVAVRVAPFLVFVVLTASQSWFGGEAKYWIYLLKAVVSVLALAVVYRQIPELEWSISLAAILVGVGVFAVWVGLDPYYPHLGSSSAVWNPFAAFGARSGLAWFFVVVRILSATLLVPMIEEVFFRSLVYRYVMKVDWQSAPLRAFAWTPFLLTSVFFGAEHYEWLAGILCGMAYQGLVCRKNRLGDAVTAHAVTNGLLGIWVVWRGAWHFW